MDVVHFSDLDISPELKAVTAELGYEKLTAIQAQSLPWLLKGQDIIGQAKTGSGKTAAFAIPILNSLRTEEKQVQALILSPTRELAAQVAAEIRKLGRRLEGLQVLTMTGGQSGREQSIAIERGTQIVVGTPGRVVDQLGRSRLDLNSVRTIVFDEADKMLEMGFARELLRIMSVAPKRRQTILFSATFPESISLLSKRFQKNPRIVNVEYLDKLQIQAFAYDSEDEDKENILMRVLQQHPANSTIVFCNMKSTVASIVEKLRAQNVDCGELHGDLEQKERDRQLALFRNNSTRILIATDVAARGLDIEHLELVVNFDFPLKPETYIHRIGRTGRAGKSGVAILLPNSRDTVRILELEKLSGIKFQKRPLGFKHQFGLNKALREGAMKTLSISGGRKDKLRPGDILGALTGENGLAGSEVGKIQIEDKISYVAVSSSVADQAIEYLRSSRIKGHKYQVRFVTK